MSKNCLKLFLSNSEHFYKAMTSDIFIKDNNKKYKLIIISLFNLQKKKISKNEK